VHILSKVFVVLVALLSVALMPLVVTQSANQAKYKAEAESAKSELASVNATLQTSQALSARLSAGLQAQKDQLEGERSALQSALDDKVARILSLEREVANAQVAQAKFQAGLDLLSSNDREKIELVKKLTDQLTESRTREVQAREELVGAEGELESLKSKLENAVQARRDLEEEVQKLMEAKSQADARGSAPSSPSAALGAAGETERVAADRNLVARIIDVRRTEEAIYAEIDAGSSSGVRQGWTLMVGDGSTFVGDLRIIRVDVNRAVGIVELEDASGRGEVRAGQRAVARKGE
jgi:predicted  nucleic acid-binding Zn-ribbon protein